MLAITLASLLHLGQTDTSWFGGYQPEAAI
jgi:hypothetical protein